MATQKSAKSVQWVEGLRGIASVMVIITHIARAFDYPLFFPSDEHDLPPRLFQLPIIRVPIQGRIGVPIFAFLTGFVCALKPLKLARNRHQQGEALMAIARSIFRRPPRLILPATIATFITFCLTIVGGFESADSCDSSWVRFDAPGREATYWREVKRFFAALLTTWTSRENPFDRHQWALLPLLVGAFQVYLVVLATMGSRLMYRLGVHGLIMLYWWLNREPYTETFGSMLSLGTLLADLSLHRPTQNFIVSHSRLLSLVVVPCLITIGLLIGSYPQEHEDWSPWSLWLHDTFVNRTPTTGASHSTSRGSFLVPEGTEPTRRLTSVGIQLCAVAVFLSPGLREALGHRVLLWLGHHSFAVYLVHGTIMRTVGIWIAYGLRPEVERRHHRDGPHEEFPFTHVRSRASVYAAVVIFVLLSYAAAWAWMRWVDTACARATRWLEAKVFESLDEDVEGYVVDAAEKGVHRAGGSLLNESVVSREYRRVYSHEDDLIEVGMGRSEGDNVPTIPLVI